MKIVKAHLGDEHGVCLASGSQHDRQHAPLRVKGDIVQECPLALNNLVQASLSAHIQDTLVQQVGHASLQRTEISHVSRSCCPSIWYTTLRAGLLILMIGAKVGLSNTEL